MCGRFALYSPPSTLVRRFGTDTIPGMEERYNIAPSQRIAIIRAEDGQRRFAPAYWGLIPFWAKDARIGYSMINARAETVAEKPAFRTAFKQRRCLIPADGFYEWQVLPGAKTKQPGSSRSKVGSPWPSPDYGSAGKVRRAGKWSPAPSS